MRANAKQLQKWVKRGLVKAEDLPAVSEARRQEKENNDPAVKLLKAAIREFGCFFEGGEVVGELNGVIPGRRYRFDIALPRFLLAVEFDGFRSHGLSKDGFHRDREKDLLASLQGWQVIRISKPMVENELASTIEAIGKIANQRRHLPGAKVDPDTISVIPH